jgi:hypothetical protein
MLHVGLLPQPAATGPCLVRRVVERAAALLAEMGQLPLEKDEAVPRVLVPGCLPKVEEVVKQAMADSHMVLLCGMAGIGKTTLAKAVFNREHGKDRTVPCHFARLHSGMREPCDVLPEQAELLKQLAGVDVTPLDAASGRGMIAEQLKGQKVVLVVDNVWGGQLGWLLPDSIMTLLGHGSMVLVTSRDQAAAHSISTVSGVVVEQLGCLSEKHSLELLCWHAYGQSFPPAAEQDEVDVAIGRCGGLPMAVEVVGRHLRVVDREQFFDSMEEALPFVYRQERAGRLEKQQTVFEAVELSWEQLDDDERQALLDLAWFTGGLEWKLVSCYCEAGVLQRLHSLSLLTLSGPAGPKQTVDVHNVIVDFCKMHAGSRYGVLLKLCEDDVADDPNLNQLLSTVRYHVLLVVSAAMLLCLSCRGFNVQVPGVRGLHVQGGELEGTASDALSQLKALRLLWLECSFRSQQCSLSLSALPNLQWLCLQGSTIGRLNQSLQLQVRVSSLICDLVFLDHR